MSTDKLFINHCKNGNLDLVKELLDKKRNINISANNDEAFRLSCSHGHLEIAQLLFSLKKI
jgi:ankyrin repeat protein